MKPLRPAVVIAAGLCGADARTVTAPTGSDRYDRTRRTTDARRLAAALMVHEARATHTEAAEALSRDRGTVTRSLQRHEELLDVEPEWARLYARAVDAYSTVPDLSPRAKPHGAEPTDR